LLQCCVPALRITVAIATFIDAPRIVLLRLGRFFDADDNRENSRDEKQKPHERFLKFTPETPMPNLFPTLCASRRVGFRPKLELLRKAMAAR
jgi:hypothetical protein